MGTPEGHSRSGPSARVESRAKCTSSRYEDLTDDRSTQDDEQPRGTRDHQARYAHRDLGPALLRAGGRPHRGEGRQARLSEPDRGGREAPGYPARAVRGRVGEAGVGVSGGGACHGRSGRPDGDLSRRRRGGAAHSARRHRRAGPADGHGFRAARLYPLPGAGRARIEPAGESDVGVSSHGRGPALYLPAKDARVPQHQRCLVL